MYRESEERLEQAHRGFYIQEVHFVLDFEINEEPKELSDYGGDVCPWPGLQGLF